MNVSCLGGRLRKQVEYPSTAAAQYRDVNHSTQTTVHLGGSGMRWALQILSNPSRGAFQTRIVCGGRVYCWSIFACIRSTCKKHGFPHEILASIAERAPPSQTDLSLYCLQAFVITALALRTFNEDGDCSRIFLVLTETFNLLWYETLWFWCASTPNCFSC